MKKNAYTENNYYISNIHKQRGIDDEHTSKSKGHVVDLITKDVRNIVIILCVLVCFHLEQCKLLPFYL